MAKKIQKSGRNIKGKAKAEAVGLRFKKHKRGETAELGADIDPTAGFTLEVTTVHIPGWVEVDQIGAIAASLARVDPDIPYGIIAFFPEHELRDVPSPDYHQMVGAFEASVDAGLRNVRLGNLGRWGLLGL